MYEPIRTKSVHTMAGAPSSDFPHRSREEELDIQLAGHLAALLAVTDELREPAPSADLDNAAVRLAQQVSRLRGGRTPVRSVTPGGDQTRRTALHERAHSLAGAVGEVGGDAGPRAVDGPLAGGRGVDRLVHEEGLLCSDRKPS